MAVNQQQSKLIFKYAIIADTHLRTPDESSSPWKTNLLTNDRARWVTNAINNHRPDFVIHLGDVVHPIPPLLGHKPASDAAQKILGGLTSPCYYVPGNHDVGDKDNPTVPAHAINNEYLKYFHERYGSTFQSFDHLGIHFIIINSPALNSGLEEEAIQRDWLEAELENHDSERIHIFSHYPPYLHQPNEPCNYDNVDQPGRKWLLNLLQVHNVEALFAGHVHQFFYKRFHDTDIYNLLSTSNLRQDYANMFRVEPAEEFGRNDPAKLGYCIIDINTDDFVVHVHRSYGKTLGEEKTLKKERKLDTIHTSIGLHSPLGVQLRYPLAEVTELPNIGPLDEFVRKKARDDYTVLALWETGIRTIRLPLADLNEKTTRQRLWELHKTGIRYGFFAINKPSTTLIAKHRDLIDFLEIVLPWEKAAEAITEVSKLREKIILPTYLANIESSVHRIQTAQTFSHYVSSGFHIDDTSKLDPILPTRGAVDGFVFEIGQHEYPLPTAKRIREYATAHGFTALINVRLAPENPAEYLNDDNYNTNRVAEAAIAAYAYPDVKILIDTFTDHDRGYFPRIGLYDRLLNPRRAAIVLRHINSTINRYGTKISEPSRQVSPDWTTITFHSTQTIYKLNLPNTSDAKAISAKATKIDLTTGTINPNKLCDGAQHFTLHSSA